MPPRKRSPKYDPLKPVPNFDGDQSLCKPDNEDDDYLRHGEGDMPTSWWKDPKEYHHKKMVGDIRRRSMCKMVAHAMVDAVHNIKSAAKILSERTLQKWSDDKVENWVTKTETKVEIYRLERKAEALTLHNREELVQRITDSLHANKGEVYIPGTWDLKPFEEWPEALQWSFDGLDWKTPKGQPPIPVPKFLSKEGLIEKAGREMGLFKDKVEHTGKDGGAMQFEDIGAAKELLASRIAGLSARGRAESVPKESD
jgi:hypothetical protein